MEESKMTAGGESPDKKVEKKVEKIELTYQVVQDEFVEKLNERVSQLKSEGWKTTGGVNYARVSSTNASYMQAMEK